MAIIKRVLWDPIMGQERINVQDEHVTISGDVRIQLPNGDKVALSTILERLAALEEAYMEDKLLGVEPGKIET